jgi:Zn-dependent protease with chaperone function
VLASLFHMANNSWQSILLTVVIALTPAFLSAWWGRALMRMIEDAAIGERLLNHKRKNLQLTVIAMVILAVGMPHTLLWSIPLLIISRAIAAFPARRILLDETWNLAEYLIGVFRLYAGLLGFWILLAASPFLAGIHHWQVGIVVCAVLALWNRWYAEALLRMLGAKPLQSEVLEPRFASVVERSKVPAPSVWRAGPAGATIANALALPSLKKSSVLISETLLDRFNEEETTAIFAHEIAHLEYYNRSRISWGNTVVFALIAIGTLVLPFFHGMDQSVSPLAPLWPLFVIFYLAFRSRHTRANEQASDLRAVELCGNAEALISALIKLHVIGRMPRRWELKMEASASHPSLANRIRAIRNAAPVTVLSEPQWCEIFRAAENSVFVAFDADSLRQFRSVPADCAQNLEALQSTAGTFTAIRYSQLVDLRVAVKGKSNPSLIFMERNGKQQTLPMQAEDLPRLQRTLDRVDVLLPPAPPKLHTGRPLARIAALVASLVFLAAQLWSVWLVAFAAAIRPTIRTIAAAALASALALVLVVTRGTLEPEQRLIAIVGILPLAATALWMSFRSRHKDFTATEQISRRTLWVAGIIVLVYLCLPFLAAQGSLLFLSKIYKTTVVFVVFPLTMAMLLAREEKKSLRVLALFFAIAGCIPMVLGTQWFRDRYIRDPLVAPFPEFIVSNLPTERVAGFAVEPGSSDLRLSPRGTRVAVRYGDVEDEDSYSFAIYEINGARRNTVEEAVDLNFIDESQMLVLRTNSSALSLDLVTESKSPSLIWRSPSKSIRSGKLAVAPATGEWRILTQTREGNLLRFEGILGKDSVNRTEWVSPIPDENWANSGTAGSGPVSIWVHQRWRINNRSLADLLSPDHNEYPVESKLFFGHQANAFLAIRSEAQVTCLDPPVGEDKTICFADYDGKANVLAVDLLKEATHAFGSLPDVAWSGVFGNHQTVLFRLKGTPVLLNLPKRHLFRLSSISEAVSYGTASSSGSVGILAKEQDRMMITIFRFDENLIR